MKGSRIQYMGADVAMAGQRRTPTEGGRRRGKRKRERDRKVERLGRRREGLMEGRVLSYEERDVQECWNRTGAAPTSTKWVDVDKGGAVRSRWVGRDFKKKGERCREDLFASMPPLEAKKLLFALAAPRLVGRGTKKGQAMKLMFIDVREAHVNADCEKDDVYVELPPEAQAGTGKCGLL